jgi:hypothetical protein
MFASVWGYYLGRSYLQTGRWLSTSLLSVAIAAALHGFYDFLVLSDPWFALPLSALLMLTIWVWRMVLIRGLHNRGGFEEPCEICETIAGPASRNGASSSHAAPEGPGTNDRRASS